MKKQTKQAKPSKKLTLRKNTVRVLAERELEVVAGGGPMTYSRCYCP